MKPDGWSPKLGQLGRTKNEIGPQFAFAKTQREAEIFVRDRFLQPGAQLCQAPRRVILKGNDTFL